MTITQKIALIQASIGGLKKTGINPHFRNEYVTLNQIIDAVTSLLTEQSLLLTMPLMNVAGRPAIKLRIESTDEAGELIEEVFTLPDLPDPQKMGSAITYYRRYMLMSFFNLKAEDDDGNVASQVTPVKKNTMTKVSDMGTATSDNEYEY